MELSLLTGVKIFLTIYDDCVPIVPPGAPGQVGEAPISSDGQATGAKLI